MNNAVTLVIVSGEGMRAEECTHPLFSDERNRKIMEMEIENGKKQLALAELAVLAAMKIRFGTCENNAYRRIENGKPHPADPGKGFLSIAHAGEYGACAWADTQVGLDIEYKERNLERIIEKIGAEGDVKRRVPASLWCAKESYVKMTGEGLSKPFYGITALSDRVVSGERQAFLSEGEEHLCVWAVSTAKKREVKVWFMTAHEAKRLIEG